MTLDAFDQGVVGLGLVRQAILNVSLLAAVVHQSVSLIADVAVIGVESQLAIRDFALLQAKCIVVAVDVVVFALLAQNLLVEVVVVEEAVCNDVGALHLALIVQ